MADLKKVADQLVSLTVKEVNELADILKEESIKGGKAPNISIREQIRQSLGPRDPEREAARAEFERRRQELSSGRAPGRD